MKRFTRRVGAVVVLAVLGLAGSAPAAAQPDGPMIHPRADDPGFTCPAPFGLFPHQDDPGRFWHCVNGVAYERDCPANLLFSVELNRCHWPSVAPRPDPMS